jgi:hypothetical protein
MASSGMNSRRRDATWEGKGLFSGIFGGGEFSPRIVGRILKA